MKRFQSTRIALVHVIEEMKQGAVVLASVLIAAADADKPLPRKPVPTQPKVTDPFAYPEPVQP